MTYSEVAKALDERNVPTRQEGKVWTGPTIRGIIQKEEFYKGKYQTEDGENHEYEWEALL